jgi:hypothetical protein
MVAIATFIFFFSNKEKKQRNRQQSWLSLPCSQEHIKMAIIFLLSSKEKNEESDGSFL